MGKEENRSSTPLFYPPHPPFIVRNTVCKLWVKSGEFVTSKNPQPLPTDYPQISTGYPQPLSITGIRPLPAVLSGW